MGVGELFALLAADERVNRVSCHRTNAGWTVTIALRRLPVPLVQTATRETLDEALAAVALWAEVVTPNREDDADEFSPRVT